MMLIKAVNIDKIAPAANMWYPNEEDRDSKKLLPDLSPITARNKINPICRRVTLAP